jgi:hypothetical protein
VVKGFCPVSRQNKIELCLFLQINITPVSIGFGETVVISKSEINVRGLQFDLKLPWSQQVANVI